MLGRPLDRAHSLPAPAGHCSVPLSNGSASNTSALFKGAGLDRFVERVISIEEVKLAKPRREVYLHATRLAQVQPLGSIRATNLSTMNVTPTGRSSGNAARAASKFRMSCGLTN